MATAAQERYPAKWHGNPRHVKTVPPCLPQTFQGFSFTIKKTRIVTIMKDVFLSMVFASHSHSRSPFRACNLAMRFGKLLQRLSTSRSLFTLSQHCFNRAAKASSVSSHARRGTLSARRVRKHDTAVSCNMSSCKLPGCFEALSPMKAVSCSPPTRPETAP